MFAPTLFRVSLAVFCLVIFGCSSWQREPANVDPRPRHWIVLVHGIAGDRTHFGSMEQGLPAHLSALDPEYSHRVYPFEYRTGDDSLTTVDFAQDLDVFLKKLVSESGGLQPQDKVSFVVHSQGGLVTSIWLLNASRGQYSAFSSELAGRVDAFITLGTPFWGAKIAEFAGRLKDLSRKVGVPLPLPKPVGALELREMSIGSDTVTAFQRTVIESQPEIRRLLQRVRVLQVAAVAADLLFLSPFVSGGGFGYEDDTAVPLPSARFDFNYVVDKSDYEANDFIAKESFRSTDLVSRFHIVNALHISPLPQQRRFTGVSQIPDRCVNQAPVFCNHPAYNSIVSFLAGHEQTPRVHDFQPKSFLAQLILHVPNAANLRPGDVRISLMRSSGVKMDNFLELYRKGMRIVTEKNEVRLYFTGYLPDGAAFARFSVEVTGVVPRQVEMPFEPAKVTFAELTLKAAN